VTDLHFLPAVELCRLLATGELSSVELLLDHFLRRVNEVDGPLNAVVALDADRARQRAAEADAARARGESRGPPGTLSAADVGVFGCLPPEPTDQGWHYIDLELDPVRHEDGRVEIEDEDGDELTEAREQDWMSADDAELARRVADETVLLLRDHVEPGGDEGWRRLG
jgi:hypothetical protein